MDTDWKKYCSVFQHECAPVHRLWHIAGFAVVQVAGLKHFDDMQQRIPRSEVEQVHSQVCLAVRDVLGVEGLPDADRLHCRVTGSYIRGKPMTGAIGLFTLQKSLCVNYRSPCLASCVLLLGWKGLGSAVSLAVSPSIAKFGPN